MLKDTGTRTVHSYDVSTADLIVSIAGKRVRTASDFLEVVESHQPGETIAFLVMRKGKPKEIQVTLGAS